MSSLEENANVGTIVPGEEAPANQVATPAVEQTEGAAPDVESRARAQGWVPKEEFRGPADKWKPAGEFVKHGEETLPILRERLRALERDKAILASQVQSEQQQRQQDFARLERMNTVALDRQRRQIHESYEAAKANAVQTADFDRYQQLVRDQAAAITAHDTEVQRVVQPVQPQQPGSPYSPAQQQTLGTWQERNPWFSTDDEMKTVAVLHSQRLANQTPGITLEENLAATEQYIRQRFSDRFPKRAAAAGPAVEGGSRTSAAAPRGKSASDLPPEAKRAFDKWVKEGLYKPNEINDYAKEYFAQ